MTRRKFSRRRFWRDLTRTRHMTAVSAVVLGTTFMPLLGVPDMQELRTFQSAVEGFSDARAAVLTPRRNDEAARERSAHSVIGEAERRDDRAERGAERMLTVERPDREPAEVLDTADILPLPPVDAPELAAPVEDQEIVVPEPEEPAAEALPELEDDAIEPEEPIAAEEEEEEKL